MTTPRPLRRRRPTAPPTLLLLLLLLLLAATLVLTPALHAQPRQVGQPRASASLPVGVWRGTSVCVALKPACKDERVVYHIAPAAGADSVTLVMNKVVDGGEEEMGTLACRFERATRALVCAMPAGRRPGEWRFVQRGSTLDGTLTLADGLRVREIHVRRRARA